MTFISRSMPQVIAYNNDDEINNVYFAPHVEARSSETHTTPKITIYDSGGSVLVTATNMARKSSIYGNTGWIAFDTMTADPVIGELITGGTTGATGYISSIEYTNSSPSAGYLFLTGWDKTDFLNNEVLTGSESFIAAVNLTTALVTRIWQYNVDTTTTSTWGLGTNYSFMVTWQDEPAGGVINRTDYQYFDISFLPAVSPNILSEEIDMLYPQWTKFRPDQWGNAWVIPIKRAHADLVNRVRLNGELAASFVKSVVEFSRIELAFVKYQIAESCGFPREEKDAIQKEREEAWAGRGLLTFDSDQETSTINEDKKLISSGFQR